MCAKCSRWQDCAYFCKKLYATSHIVLEYNQ